MTSASENPVTHHRWVVSVRDLVDFVLRRGALTRGSFRSARRAREGTQGHQDVQKQRPPNYQAEVAIRDEIITPEGQTLIVQGRIDGILPTSTGYLLEEIKTVVGEWDGEPRETHWNQAKVYAALFARQEDIDALDVQLTYLHLDTQDLSLFRRSFSFEDLQTYYHSLTSVYAAWIDLQGIHRQLRDASVRAAEFPFAKPRQGQEQLLWKAAETLQQPRGTLLAEAPTGIGKTISVLFSAIQTLPRSDDNLRLVYLTAKTTGHESARQAVSDLKRSGVQLRALAFAARDRLCFGQENGSPCDVESCPYALAYYTNRQEAMREALDHTWIGLETLQTIGRTHSVCPSALAIDLVPWVDLVVCDYNYVFDPTVRLAALSNEGQRQIALLIDEAHNLPDRARSMFSAAIGTPALLTLKRLLGTSSPDCRQAIEQIVQALNKISQSVGIHRPSIQLDQRPAGLRSAIGAFLVAADHALSRRENPAIQEELQEVYYTLSHYLRLQELGTEATHVHLFEQWGPGSKKHQRLRWLCLNPAPLLAKVYRETGPAVIFSATLSPTPYFQQLLGRIKESRQPLTLPSPFPRENLGLMVHTGIATTYRRRAESYEAIADVLTAFTQGRRGHYFAYFSSFDYLQKVEEILRSRRPKGLRILSQSADMDLNERQAFLKHFQDPPSGRTRTSLLGLAVLGGVFSEGVDLVGDRLIGVAVIGVGLPQVNPVNDLIKDRFSITEDGRSDEALGFDFAYTYPGFNRVLQAVGRLIRSENDRGMALLIDERYRQQRYRELFPSWWQPKVVRSIDEMIDCEESFWNDAPGHEAPH